MDDSKKLSKHPHILACGSVNIDVIAESNQDPSAVYKKGKIGINFGGGGHNAAINLKELGCDVSLLTALNDSAMTNLALAHVESHGITPHVHITNTLEDSIFVGLFHQGTLQNAISSSALEKANFPDDFLYRSFKGKDAILTTAVFSEEMLHKLSRLAEEKKIPFFVNVTSEAHAHKIAGIPYITCAFMNMREAKKLQQVMDASTLHEMAEEVGHELVVLKGKSAVCHLKPKNRTINHNIEALEVTGNTLGIGDLLVCNLVTSYAKHGSFNFHSCRERAPEILECTYGHLGHTNPLKLSIKQETQKADADTLTGVLNRRGVHKFVERKASAHGKLSALLLDIDHFKKVNDTYGHDVGDNVIRSVSEQLKRFTRASDALSRWGGEEFLLLLPGLGTSAAYNLAERIRSQIEASEIEGVDHPITISIGLAERDDEEDFMTLVKHADIALYEAKDKGRNQVICYTKNADDVCS